MNPPESSSGTHDLEAVLGAFVHDTRSIAVAAEGLAFRAAARVTDERARAYLNAIHESMLRLAEMATATFEFARWESPLNVAPTTLVDLGEIAEIVGATLSDDFAEQGVVLALSTERTVLLGDRTGIYRILLNLLNNALRHGPRTGPPLKVLLDVRATTAGPTLTVEDSGLGYPAALLARDFRRPVWRSGRGLGLPIVARIVALHGGSLQLSKSSLGGARALVCFPAAPPSEHSHP